MKHIDRNELDPPIREALEVVEAALERSYCPHSGLSVAAGLILSSGEVVTGINYESASYGLTLCAERTAIAKAQSEGSVLKTTALVLASSRGDGPSTASPLSPCGACRQWLCELSNRLGHDIPVYSFWKDGASGLAGTARQLLPSAFEKFQ